MTYQFKDVPWAKYVAHIHEDTVYLAFWFHVVTLTLVEFDFLLACGKLDRVI